MLSSSSASPNQLPVRRWVTMEKKQPCHTLVLTVKGADRSTLQLTLCVVSLERPWMILMIIICKGTAVCYFFFIDATYIDLTSLFLTQACWISNQHAIAILDLIGNRNLNAMLDNPRKKVKSNSHAAVKSTMILPTRFGKVWPPRVSLTMIVYISMIDLWFDKKIFISVA